MAVDTKKQYRYKIFNRHYQYIGELENVINDPKFVQQINNFSSELVLELAIGDVSELVETGFLLNEDGTYILDEDGGRLILEFPGNPYIGEGGTIDSNYNVEVIELEGASYGGQTDVIQTAGGEDIQTESGQNLEATGLGLPAPGSGATHVVFRGYVLKWQLPIGGDKAKVFLRPGTESLDRTTLQGDDSEEVENTASNDGTTAANIIEMEIAGTETAIQEFTLTTETRLNYVQLLLSFNAARYLENVVPVGLDILIAQNLPSDVASFPSVAKGSGYHFITPNPAHYNFRLENPVTLQAGTYYLVIRSVSAFNYRLWASNSAYSGGVLRTYVGNVATQQAKDLNFTLFSESPETTITFDNMKPSDIFKALCDYGLSRGLPLNYDSNSIADSGSGSEVTYTFKKAKLSAALKKTVELCPATFYAYYDFGANKIHLVNSLSNSVRQIGRDALKEEGYVEETIEFAVSKVNFTGGRVGNENLFVVEESNDPALRPNAIDLNDNRVTVEETARRLAREHLERNKDPKRAGKITLVDNDVFDLRVIKIGDFIQLIELSPVIGERIFQVHKITYLPNTRAIELGYVRPRIDEAIRGSVDELDKLGTADLPDSPI